MDTDNARSWVINASLLITAANFVFFFVAPAVGFPLTFDQAARLLEIVIPVFLGYLGSATHFLFRPYRPRAHRAPVHSSKLLGILVRGPVVVFGIATLAAIFAFGFSNRKSAPPGVGMGIDDLAGALAASLGLLAVTTSVAVSYLFSRESMEHG